MALLHKNKILLNVIKESKKIYLLWLYLLNFSLLSFLFHIFLKYLSLEEVNVPVKFVRLYNIEVGRK
jgi:hypothetical protein